MSANTLSWTELECLIQQRYPGISRDEAYVRLFYDLKPLMDPTAKGSFSILKALGIIFNKPVTSLVASASRIAQRILKAISQNPTCTSQPVEDNPNDISDQIIIQMLRNLAATAGEPSNVAADTGFSLCGENMIEHRIGGFTGGSAQTFKILSNSFNAGPDFTAVFASCALVSTALDTQTKPRELQTIGLRLQDVPDELSYQTTARVQSWQTQGFGYFIYRFVDNEIQNAGGEKSVGRHAFYVYNRTTSANEAFERRARKSPFPSSFGGMASNLEAVFSLMWQNRRSLRQIDPVNADNVVFHLLVPAKMTFVIAERMAIDDGIGKLIIKGHTDEGAYYAWFNFVSVPRQVVLYDVGNLDTDSADLNRSWKGEKNSARAFFGCGLVTVIAGFVIPPAAPYFAWLCFASLAMAMKYGVVDHMRRSFRSPPRILGPPSGFRQE
ncbi:hypothetical protein ABHI18_009040 [Aspergillus niger]